MPGLPLNAVGALEDLFIRGDLGEFFEVPFGLGVAAAGAFLVTVGVWGERFVALFCGAS